MNELVLVIVGAILGAVLTYLFLTKTQFGWEIIENYIQAESYETEVEQEKRRVNESSHQDKDYSLVSILYNGGVYEESFQKTHIGYFTVKLLQDKGLLDDKVLKFLRDDKSSNYFLLKTEEEMSDDDKRKRYHLKEEREIIYKGEAYYASSQWSLQNIKPFMDKIEDRFSEIKFKGVE